jgi:hypothetical protein
LLHIGLYNGAYKYVINVMNIIYLIYIKILCSRNYCCWFWSLLVMLTPMLVWGEMQSTLRMTIASLHFSSLPSLHPSFFHRVHPPPRASSSCVYSQCAVLIAVGPCVKGHFIHAGPTFGPGVLLLLLTIALFSINIK